jgi:hypothetical protein
VSPWHDLITPAPRQVVVYSHWPVDQALAILGDLASGRRGAFRAAATRGLRLLDGSVDGRTVTFTAVPASRAAAADSAPESRSLEFRGSIEATPDGSVLAGSISAAPTAFGLPAAALTVLVALFLAWNAIPLPLVALGVVAWVFLTGVVVGGIGEQRLAGADAIGRLLEDALA